MEYEVYVIFRQKGNSKQHAEQVVLGTLAGKGVHPRGEVELTNGRVEKLWGFERVSVVE